MLRIGIVAGETSGDAIAADLIRSIKIKYPDAIFEGIAGPEMQAAGCKAIYETERLSVMAITEVLKRLPELLKIRKTIFQHFVSNPPDVFIGVDAPDFNLTLERKLKQHNIPVVHYVSPSVWAWRQYRVKKIAKSIDLMLVLFPFEAKFYQRFQVPVKFVGHPMADQIPLESNKADARETLGLSANKVQTESSKAAQETSDYQVLALLPGSRMSEVSRLLPLLLETARHCYETNPTLRITIPAATPAIETYIREAIDQNNSLPKIDVFQGLARSVMQAADVIVLASGTATLEAMLLNRPMIVTYKVSGLSYWIMKKLAKVRYISLPNFFGDSHPVPEFIQENATLEKVGPACAELLANKTEQKAMCCLFQKNHVLLKLNASQVASDTILDLVSK